MGRHLIKKDINKDFTAGEEAILEQVCIILDRRKKVFISKHFRENKKISLEDNFIEDTTKMNESQNILKIIEDIKDIKTNTSNNYILLNKLIDRTDKLNINSNNIKLEMLEEFEHIFNSGKNIFEISDMFSSLKDKYIKQKGD